MQVNSATIQKSFFDLKQVIATLDTSSVSQAEIDVILSRIEELHTYLLNRDELFLKILKKSKTRSINDSKVAPGSNAVQRSFSDDRFLLCHVAVFRSRVHQKLNDLEGALSSLSEALLWFPRSLESLQRYTTLLKTKAGSPEELDVLETILRRAVAAFDQLRQAASGTVERSILADELEHGRTATESLCLLLSQRGNEAEANELMQRLGFTWRLSQQVIHYPLHVPSSAFSSASASATPCPVAYAIDGAVSQTQLRHLRSLFRSNSPFWSEHDYDALVSNCSRRVGYFSYLYPFRERAAACSLERVINRVFQAVCERFPGVAEGAQVAEWWVHSRVHSSGHQLHFDSDETSIEDGGAPHHPLVSCVLFLDADVGGPTLVTDQLLCDDHLANQGWLFYGHENRLVMFDAKYLHGVIPGRGPSPDGGKRRLTFMVGFWDHISARDRGLDSPGPGQPLPDPTTSRYTWVSEMMIATKGEGGVSVDDEESAMKSTVSMSTNPKSNVEPIYVSSIWERIDSTGDISTGLGDGSAKVESLEKSATQRSTPEYHECFQGF